MTPIQRQMLTLSFGLENDPHFNPTQIGQQLNLSGERIRQMMH
ncbi:sigma factor-like helix-turn-helix DNA-binding protein [Nostoc sp.]